MPCGGAVAELSSVQPVVASVAVQPVESRQGKDVQRNEILHGAFFGQSCTPKWETF